MRKLLTVVLLVFTALVQASTVEPRSFDDAAQEARYRKLIAELRCLVCQNQNLADSDADLAKDLRDETYGMIRAGQSDEQIIDFMVNRYGDFVLYRPPVKSSTFLLWFGPLLLVAAGLLIVVLQVRRRAATAAGKSPSLSPDERKRIDELLAKSREDRR